MDDKLREKVVKCSENFYNVSGEYCTPVNYKEKKILNDKNVCTFCENCMDDKCGSLNILLYGCHEAYRWSGSYIYHCPLGLILVAASITDETGELLGGLVSGPIRMGEEEDMVYEDQKMCMNEKISGLKVRSPQMVQSLSELLKDAASFLSGTSNSRMEKYFYEQEKCLNTLYMEGIRIQADGEYYTYPIGIERRLRDAVTSKDKDSSQALLNQILAYIYISNNYELEAVLPRIAELVIVISRSAVDAGADINEIFHLNENFMSHMEEFKTIEELSSWITSLLLRYISATFDFAEIKHADVVYKTIEYIKMNYYKRMTLEEIAESAYLSKTYLSSIFKKETGQSISGYINKIRVDKSKTMLLQDNSSIIDIANACGFEDQSYYTKVFKNIVGMTPKKFRENRGKEKKTKE
ncbi:AraC family transcriptional regulator [Parasporobacterium paucivorans]|uniref:AraC-type DNA-binding protein n=1 Tax=Parasporobacterium paucivorans DSM 15970 TaxID=1122934 RepID=A0A1M6JB03_9FIRM|nr:AraC family transcriptional regulator [Parasporobacterium paucivorans]SHJ43896.1 AraC-type DNA-binding protein [Parasporobacterium paucivorans DSM 15970]